MNNLCIVTFTFYSNVGAVTGAMTVTEIDITMYANSIFEFLWMP